jgi:hypothetical protein
MRLPPAWVPRAVRDVAGRVRYGDVGRLGDEPIGPRPPSSAEIYPALKAQRSGARELRRRLLCDERMRQVWTTLKVKGRKVEIEHLSKRYDLKRFKYKDPSELWYKDEDPCEFLPENLRMGHWGAPARPASFANRLAAAFYLAALDEFAIPGPPRRAI